MSTADQIPCVLVWCKVAGKHFVWFAKEWDRDSEHFINTGRKLIARAPNSTCRILRDLLNQQLESNHGNSNHNHGL
jgi:hypothetical protein